MAPLEEPAALHPLGSASSGGGDKVGVELRFGGRWEQQPDGLAKYVGGQKFWEKVPASSDYAELMHRMSAKVNGAVTLKYAPPGEPLADPENLVTVIDNEHVQEMFEEYWQAARQAARPGATFRLKIWLVPAEEDDLTPEQLGRSRSSDRSTSSAETAGRLRHRRHSLVHPRDAEMQEREAAEMVAFMHEEEEAAAEEAEAWQEQQQAWAAEQEDAWAEAAAWEDAAAWQAEQQQQQQQAWQAHMASNLARASGRTFDSGGWPRDRAPALRALQQAGGQQFGGGSACLPQPGAWGWGSAAGLAPTADTGAYFTQDPFAQPGPAGGSAGAPMEVSGGPERPPPRWALPSQLGSGLGGAPIGTAEAAESAHADCLVAGVVQAALGEEGQPPEQQRQQGRLSPAAVADLNPLPGFTESYHAGVIRKLLFDQSAAVEPQTGLPEQRCQLPCGSDPSQQRWGPAYGRPAPSPPLGALGGRVLQVAREDISVQRPIGEGTFGEVVLASHEVFGTVAVKWLKAAKADRHRDRFWEEACLLAGLNHPNVLRFYGVVTASQGDPAIVGIMTEFMPGHSLSSYLRSGAPRIPLPLRAELARAAVNGLAYLHALNIVHFDLKPDNLLLDRPLAPLPPGGRGQAPTVKVADFGLSKQKADQFVAGVRDLRGTLPYMAPELVADPDHVTEAADVWSLGVVLWEMYTGETPYQQLNPQDIIARLAVGQRPELPAGCEPEWAALMDGCMRPVPSHRLTLRELAARLDAIMAAAPPPAPGTPY